MLLTDTKAINHDPKLNNILKLSTIIVQIISISISLFSLWTAAFGILEAWMQRAVHIFLILLLAFALPVKNDNESNDKWLSYNWLNILGFILTVIAGLYAILNYYPISVLRVGNPNLADAFMASLTVILVIVATWKHLGKPIALIVVFIITYAIFGRFITGSLRILQTPAFSYKVIINNLYNTTFGIFGVPLGVASTYIIIFIIFGGFLIYTKAGDAFIRFAYAVAGKIRGGPALAAVIASGLIGMIHGTAAGNVVITGTFTIPTMIKLGYKRHFAAAVEASASTGGILLPPIMGSSAFLMAEFTKTPYATIIIYALVPALLYYLGVGISVYIEAVKENLATISEKDRIPIRKAVIDMSPLFIPVAALVWMLMIGRSPMNSGLYTIILVLIFSMFRKETRLNLNSLFQSLAYGGEGIIKISLACASAGVLISFLSISGADIKVPMLIGILSGNVLIIGLLLTGLMGLILGMGMPGVAVYVLLATVAVPTLQRLGASIIASHLFVIYVSALTVLVPPVALASIAAAPLAGANIWETSITALKLSSAGFIIPIMFVYNENLLLMGSNPLLIIISVISAAIGVTTLALATIGWLPYKCYIWHRVILVIVSILLIGGKSLYLTILALICSAIIIISQVIYKRAIDSKI